MGCLDRIAETSHGVGCGLEPSEVDIKDGEGLFRAEQQCHPETGSRVGLTRDDTREPSDRESAGPRHAGDQKSFGVRLVLISVS